MTDEFFRQLFSEKVKLASLMNIDLSKNKLGDYILVYLQKLTKESRKLSSINLSFNEITLSE